jgi:hypothetical protein
MGVTYGPRLCTGDDALANRYHILQLGFLAVSAFLGWGCRSDRHRIDVDQIRTGDAATRVKDADRQTAEGKALRFAGPLTAVMTSSLAAVAGRDRKTGQVVLAFSSDGTWASERTVRIAESGPATTDDIELFGSQQKLALTVRGLAGKERARHLYRIDFAGDAGVRLSSPVDAGDASCATSDGVFSLYREADTFRGQFWPFSGTATAVEGLLGPAKSEATLVCGQHRVFFATATDETSRILTWLDGEKLASPGILPKTADSPGESETSMAPFEDQLVAVKLDQTGTVRIWKWKGGASPAAWTKASLGGKGEAGLEAVIPAAGMLGLVMTRTVDPGKSCRDSDALDTVAEVAVISDVDGRVVHAPERIETWRCGAEPGPFFSGWVQGQLVVAWPRGADAACAKVGVRHGGITYAVIEPKATRARIGRAGRPAEAIADAGCVDGKCFVAAVTR